MDLKFPHHENEIAQTCAACESRFVERWMHNGFVNVDAEKMSKSLGNFFTVREVLATLRPEVLRTFVLGSHYRGPINYSDENLRQADAALERLYVALRGVEPAPTVVHGPATERFKAAMDDDFNTPEALAVLQQLARDLNVAKNTDATQARGIAAELRCLGQVLGILTVEAEDWLRSRPASEAAGGRLDAAAIESLIEARRQARAARDFKASDRIRDELAAQGVLLEDGPGGTTWRYR
jgi:cysteinyl-tRNA synthetase